MLVKTSSILTNKRIRKNLGDLDSLADSIDDVGLLHPIVVKPNMELVAGYRRLMAIKEKLGYAEVEVTIVENINDTLAELKAERDENVCRLDFTPSEAVAMGRAIEPLERMAAADRQKVQDFGRGVTSEKFTGVNGNALDHVAAAVGMSRPTYTKAKEIIEAAESNPTLLPLVEKMDQNGKVDPAYKEYQRKKRDEQEKANNQDMESKITLYHADSLSLLPTLLDSTFPLVVTDPPYNTTEHTWDSIGNDEDFILFTQSWLNAIRPKLTLNYHLFFFCDPDYAAPIEMLLRRDGWALKSRIIWEYRNLVKGRDVSDKFIENWQMCFHIGTHALNWSLDWDDKRFMVQNHATPQSNFSEGKYHPTQKPLSLIKLLVEVGSKPGDLILDLFAGSGTTGLACQELKRDCMLIERESNYCSVIENRLGVTRL